MSHVPSDIAFTPAVKAIQHLKGSRKNYARMEQSGGWQTAVTSDLTEFLADLDFPTKMRITIIQVAKGAKYDPKLVPNLPERK